VLDAVDQETVMAAVAGAEPSLAKIDVGLFAPGTPMASDAGVEITRRPDDYEKVKKELVAGDTEASGWSSWPARPFQASMPCRRSQPMFCGASA
jgi:hypothetical protein